MMGLAILATILVLAPLAAILFYLVYKGASSLNLAFFTQKPAPVGEEGGGMANAIVGSGIILSIASLLGVPVESRQVSTSQSSAVAKCLATLFASPQMCLTECHLS